MGKYNIVFTEEDKKMFLEELLEKLRNGENRNLRLSKEIGIATTTVKRFRSQLIAERKNYRRRNRSSSGRKRTKGER